MQKNEIGTRILKRRKELELTQEQLAELMGYKTKSSINKIEKGYNDVSQSKVVKFAEVLKTTVAYLMGWTDNPNIEKKEIQTTIPIDIETFYKAMYLTPFEKGGTKNICGEDLEKALELYDQYKKSIPQVQNAVDALLKPPQSDS